MQAARVPACDVRCALLIDRAVRKAQSTCDGALICYQLAEKDIEQVSRDVERMGTSGSVDGNRERILFWLELQRSRPKWCLSKGVGCPAWELGGESNELVPT
jgi:hypothetical protein